jgi:hypothetical protein
MQPESSDGLASVGTILPRKELPCCRAALSAFEGEISGGRDGAGKSDDQRKGLLLKSANMARQTTRTVTVRAARRHVQNPIRL